MDVNSFAMTAEDDHINHPGPITDTLQQYNQTTKSTVHDLNEEDDRYVLGSIAVKKKLFNRKLSESGNTEILESISDEIEMKSKTPSSDTLYMFPISGELRDAELRKSAGSPPVPSLSDTVEMDLSRTRETPVLGNYPVADDTANVYRSQRQQAVLRTLFWMLIFVAVSLLAWLLVNPGESGTFSLSRIDIPPTSNQVSVGVVALFLGLDLPGRGKPMNQLLEEAVRRIESVFFVKLDEYGPYTGSYSLGPFPSVDFSHFDSLDGEAKRKALAGMIDHSLLKPEATPEQIEQLCSEALEYSFFSVCVNSSFVPRVSDRLIDSSVAVCTVVGFPLGAMDSEAKAFEAHKPWKKGPKKSTWCCRSGCSKPGNFRPYTKIFLPWWKARGCRSK